jgi:thiamine-monophosphate kinase
MLPNYSTNFNTLSKLNVADLGETGLLELIFPYCSSGSVGDDAATILPSPGRAIVLTGDVLVENVHFSERTTSPYDVGWRAAAANLSDLAAMGASALGITVSLSLPSTVPIVWIEAMYAGLRDCTQRYGTGIVGGDITRAKELHVAVSAIGEVLPQRTIYRRRACVGDAIVVTGDHGNSRAGLELLLNPPAPNSGISPAAANDLIRNHQQPQPRFDAIKILERISPDRLDVAGMDTSDGLADAIVQVCEASGVGARVDRVRLPISRALQTLFPHQASQWCLYGGEDFELLLCMPIDLADRFVRTLGGSATIIGEIIADQTISLVDGSAEVKLDRAAAFQHFSR